MRAASLGLAVVFAAFALPALAAPARGIDCTKASSKLEKTICADKVMLEYDARIAAAYHRALTAWNGQIAAYVRQNQRIWLQRFRDTGNGESEVDCAPGDRQCLRDEMRARVDDLESGSFANSGVYRTSGGLKLVLTPGRANGYSLRVFNPDRLPDWNIATLQGDRSALWDGPDFIVSKMGDFNGLPLPRPQRGPDPDGCELRLLPKALSIQVFQKGYCGGRSYAGTYQRRLNEDLSEYEVDIH